MAERTTRLCRDCPGEIVIQPGSGPKPSRCDPCRKKRRADVARGRDAERYRAQRAALLAERATNPPTWVCVGCAQVFLRLNKGGPSPKRCEPCGRRRNLDELAKLRRAQTDARRPKSFRCQDCLRSRPVRRRHGPVPRTCHGCQMERKRLASRAEYAAKVSPVRMTLTCPGCDQEVPLARKGYSRRRCDPCAATRQRAHSAAWIKARPEVRRAKNRENRRRRRLARRAIGAEKFADREIYERDGWKCGLCGDPVDRLLKSPDLMSPSLDHIIPLNRGGPHTRKNTRCAHFVCNSRKTDRLDSEVHHVFPYLATLQHV